MREEQKEGPKIIVDEDWKSQVQAEKEKAATASAESAEPKEPAASEPDGKTAPHHVPDASLSVLVSTLAAQAMTAMGHLPDPIEGHAVVRPDLAKHYIDMLGVLDEKTKGNLTPDEAGMMENVLHELRMIFVTTRGKAGAEGNA
jgi:hypothetical protein